MLLFFVYSSAFILTIISLVHFYWGFGGKAGVHFALPVKRNGEELFSPKKFETLFVAIGLIIVAFILLVQYNLITSVKPGVVSKSFSILFSIVFILRAVGDFNYLGFFKKVNHSTFAKYDSRLYSPFCLLIGVIFIVAWL